MNTTRVLLDARCTQATKTTLFEHTRMVLVATGPPPNLYTRDIYLCKRYHRRMREVKKLDVSFSTGYYAGSYTSVKSLLTLPSSYDIFQISSENKSGCDGDISGTLPTIRERRVCWKRRRWPSQTTPLSQPVNQRYSGCSSWLRDAPVLARRFTLVESRTGRGPSLRGANGGGTTTGLEIKPSSSK